MEKEVICIYKRTFDEHEYERLVFISTKTMDVVESIELPYESFRWSGWMKAKDVRLLAKSTFNIYSVQNPDWGQAKYPMAFRQMLCKFPEFNDSRNDLEVKPIEILSNEFIEDVGIWSVTAEWGLYEVGQEGYKYFPEEDGFKKQMERLGFDMEGYGEERNMLLKEDVYRALISKYKDYKVVNFIQI